MRCHKVQQKLEDHAAGELTPQEQKRIEGHLRRCWFLACALAERDIEVDLVTGGMPVSDLSHDKIRVHQLPPVRSLDGSFLRHSPGTILVDGRTQLSWRIRHWTNASPGLGHVRRLCRLWRMEKRATHHRPALLDGSVCPEARVGGWRRTRGYHSVVIRIRGERSAISYFDGRYPLHVQYLACGIGRDGSGSNHFLPNRQK